jgi:hypothetical protein
MTESMILDDKSIHLERLRCFRFLTCPVGGDNPLACNILMNWCQVQYSDIRLRFFIVLISFHFLAADISMRQLYANVDLIDLVWKYRLLITNQISCLSVQMVTDSYFINAVIRM